MAYREKVAWLSLLTMIAVFVPYFTWSGLNPPTGPLPNFGQMLLYAIVCAVWLLLLGAGHLYLRSRDQQQALLPLDERDLAIKYRSRDYAYGVLLIGLIVVGCVMPFRSAGWEIANTAILAIVLAEAVNYISMILSYRRQIG